MKTENAIILISFPHQLAYAMSTLEYDRKCRGIDPYSPVTVVLWSYDANNHRENSKFTELVYNSLRKFPHVHVRTFSYLQRLFPLSPLAPMLFRIGWMKLMLNKVKTGSVYVSHDASADLTAQIIMHSFKHLRHIYFGDPPGFIQKQFMFTIEELCKKNWLSKVVWKLRVAGVSGVITPSLALVPIIFNNKLSGKNQTEIYQIPLEVLVENIKALTAGIIDNFSDLEQLNLTTENSCLLLLSNFSNSHLMEEKDEILMYLHAINKYVPANVTLIIKPHFGTSIKALNCLVEKLSNRKYLLLSEKLRNIPVEILISFLKNSLVVSFSSASIIVSHLQKKCVIHALDNNMIDKFFGTSSIEYMRDVNANIIDSCYKG